MSAESHPPPVVPPSQQQTGTRYTQMTGTTNSPMTKEVLEARLKKNFDEVKTGLNKIFTNQYKTQQTSVKMANFITDRIQQELRAFQIEYGLTNFTYHELIVNTLFKAVPVIIKRDENGAVVDVVIQDIKETRWHKCCALKFKSMTINGKPIIVVKEELPQRLESIAYNLLAIHPYTERKDIFPEAAKDTREGKEALAKLTPEQKRKRTSD